MLGPQMTFVHCNTLADDELELMAENGVTASISPDNELQMGHGWPATGRLLDAGIRPSLSIDVCSSNGGHTDRRAHRPEQVSRSSRQSSSRLPRSSCCQC
jgi:hypothetical protein